MTRRARAAAAATAAPPPAAAGGGELAPVARRASITIKAPTDAAAATPAAAGGGGGFTPVPFEAGVGEALRLWAERLKDTLTASLRKSPLSKASQQEIEGVLDGALAAARDAQYEAVVDATLQCVGRVQQGRRREREAMQRLKALTPRGAAGPCCRLVCLISSPNSWSPPPAASATPTTPTPPPPPPR